MKTLPHENYDLAVAPLKQVTIIKLFARSVVERHVTGLVYVNDLKAPKVFYVVHPYGMSLLFGQSNDPDFLDRLKAYFLNTQDSRQNEEWLQVYPLDWEGKIETLLGNALITAEEKDDQ